MTRRRESSTDLRSQTPDLEACNKLCFDSLSPDALQNLRLVQPSPVGSAPPRGAALGKRLRRTIQRLGMPEARMLPRWIQWNSEALRPLLTCTLNAKTLELSTK